MLTGILFILLTILFTVYGQLIIKHELSNMGIMPVQISLVLPYFLTALTNLKIISGIGSAVLAMLCWFGAASRLDLSFAYPFMSLTFPIVVFLAIIMFHEPFYWSKVFGLILILFGLVIMTLKG